MIVNQTATETQPLERQIDLPVIIQFAFVACVALIGTPLFGVLHGFTWVDWTVFASLYVITGLGITVGYHRLISHRSFECRPWVKVALLIAGGWALQNTAIK